MSLLHAAPDTMSHAAKGALAAMVAVIIGREITVSALREWMAEMGERGKVRVGWVGKFKTGFQMTAIGMMIWEIDQPFGWPWYNMGYVLLLVAAVLTLYSMIQYLLAAWPGDLATVQALVAFLETTRNDLEPPAVALAPAIGAALAELRAQPQTLFARMSGSGATCFALCADRADRETLASQLAARHSDWWVQPCVLAGFHP